MKINSNNLAILIELANNTPQTIRDYCHYDGCPTDWYRGQLLTRDNGKHLDYHCADCGTKRHYNISRLKEMKDNEETGR